MWCVFSTIFEKVNSLPLYTKPCTISGYWPPRSTLFILFCSSLTHYTADTPAFFLFYKQLKLLLTFKVRKILFLCLENCSLPIFTRVFPLPDQMSHPESRFLWLPYLNRISLTLLLVTSYLFTLYIFIKSQIIWNYLHTCLPIPPIRI